MDILKTGAFRQKITERLPFNETVLSMSVSEKGELYIATDSGFYVYSDGALKLLFDEVLFTRVYCDKKGRLLVSNSKYLYTLSNNNIAKPFAEFDDEIIDILYEDKLYVLTRRTVYMETDNGFFNLGSPEQECVALAVFGEKVCVAGSKCIQRMEGKRRTWRCIFPDHSTMPKIKINDIAFDKTGHLLVGADEGLFIYDYKDGWYSNQQISVLPQEKVYSICVCEDASFLLGTEAGGVIIRNGLSKYLPARNYAFDTNVIQVCAYKGEFFTASRGGIVKISEKEMTLREKADHIFRETEKYFPRKDGFVTWINGEKGKDISAISDNDGLWTHTYLAALCMWYAVTGEEYVLEAARKYKDAMLVLTRAPEIKGFTARAVRYPGEKNWGVGLETMGIGKEWHRSSDGTYEWLGETSSDEMTGHYAGFSLYYDLCADEEEKKEIAEAVCAITDHILDHDGYLFDYDDKPTTWACWNENALNHDSMWMWEKGVNSLEMLSFLKISHHMSGNERYEKKYKELISDHHFLINAAYHKRADGHTCHIDDNLAMFNTLSYLRLEKDEAIRQYVLMGLASHYDYESVERNPYFGFIYKAFTGADCDVDSMVRALKDHPYELYYSVMDNSNRKGLEYDDEPVYWGEAPRVKKPLAWDERPFSKMGLSAFAVNGGREDRIESGKTYLFIYWLGRYLGIIE